MPKLLKALGFVTLFYVVPLLANPTRIATPEILVLAAMTLLVFLTQPEPNLREARARARTDEWSVLAILAAGALSQLVPVLEWGYGTPTPTPAGATVGLGLIGGGLGLRLLAIQSLGLRFTATVHVVPDQEVSTRGVYGLVRHPSYTGTIVAVIGSALLLGSSVGAITGLAVMMLAYAYRIQREERELLDKLGTAYRKYRIRTRYRLFPGLW